MSSFSPKSLIPRIGPRGFSSFWSFVLPSAPRHRIWARRLEFAGELSITRPHSSWSASSRAIRRSSGELETLHDA